MARNFDGTNDNLLSADNALAGLNVDLKSVGFWVLVPSDPAGQQQVVGTITAEGGTGILNTRVTVPDVAGFQSRLTHNFSTTVGVWDSPDVTSGSRHHIAYTYDRALTTNDPVLYVDGTSVAVTEVTTPVGTAVTADDTLKMGETSTGTFDFIGTVSNIAVAVGILWSASQVNQTKWWGRLGGLLVYHPLWTDKLIDEGSGAETLTANGTTVAAFVTPCVRPGSAMMGMGIGW